MKKRNAALILLVLIMILASGCSSGPKEQVFSAKGLEVTLTEGFHETDYDTYTVSYDSSNVAVFALKEEFEFIGTSDLTVDEYADIVLGANGIEDKPVTENGVTYVVFEAQYEESYTYLAAMYKGQDAYWLIQFACKTDNFETLKPELLKYAASVKV